MFTTKQEIIAFAGAVTYMIAMAHADCNVNSKNSHACPLADFIYRAHQNSKMDTMRRAPSQYLVPESTTLMPRRPGLGRDTWSTTPI